jgi:hypothetical protein
MHLIMMGIGPSVPRKFRPWYVRSADFHKLSPLEISLQRKNSRVAIEVLEKLRSSEVESNMF